MPRPRRTGHINGEDNLARRIAYERERRGWSYETLALLVTEAGCPVAGSALHRVEKGSPRRRITVDELLALSEVFDLPLHDLLTPVELVRKKRAREVVETIKRTEEELLAATERYLAAWTELWGLAAEDLELHEYAWNHLAGGGEPVEGVPRFAEVEGANVETSAFDEAYAAFLIAAWQLAADVVEASLNTEEG